MDLIWLRPTKRKLANAKENSGYRHYGGSPSETWSDALQTANDEQEALESNYLYPNCPWYKYSTLIDFGPRYFDKGESKPIYFD